MSALATHDLLWIYAIQADGYGGDVKLGISRDPIARLKTLQVGHSEELRGIGAWPGTLAEHASASAVLRADQGDGRMRLMAHLWPMLGESVVSAPFGDGLLSRGSQVRVLPGALETAGNRDDRGRGSGSGFRPFPPLAEGFVAHSWPIGGAA